MTRLVGYTRAVTPGAGTAADAAQLTLAGAGRVFTDDGSAGATKRPGLRECLEFVEAGDTVVVTSAAMLAPTAAQFLTAVSGLVGRGVGFRSLSEPALSTGTDMDPASVFVALESLRRRLSSLQTRAGMAAAASNGRRPGRPTVMTPERVAMALELRDLGRPVTHIARVLGVSANAVQRALASHEGMAANER
ncbi:recombinase family protein [Microbacterium kunmingense]|uniref:recombinase family protein n=1 Tax=Microbacterium kunmingense TaxID=2915939 RepID=UPI003D71AF47